MMKKIRSVFILLLLFVCSISRCNIGYASNNLTESSSFGSKSENIARGKAAYASSNQRGDASIGSRRIQNLTDGDLNSFIVLHQDDTDPWYYVDMGASYSVNKLDIYQGKTADSNYQDAYAAKYVIEYRNQAEEEWKTAKVLDGTYGKNTVFLEPITARYVRLHVINKAGRNCMLYEMQIYETDFNTITDPNAEPEKPIKILFIGNSLTHYNDVAGKVRALYEAAGLEAEVSTIIRLGQPLVYHASFDDTRTTILDGDFDYVVLQDKASNFNGNDLMRGVGTINEWIEQTNAKAVLYMPWANENVFASQQKVFTDAYTAAAKAIGAPLAPAGEAYYELYFDYGYRWYSDNIHGTDLASLVSASTIFYTISGIDSPLVFTGSEPLIVRNSYDAEVVNLIQQKASFYTEKFRDLSSIIEEEEVSGTNLALYRPCVSSGDENAGMKASNLTDGNEGTRWSSEHNDSQWIYVDLGKNYMVDKVTLHWEAAYGLKYEIQVSVNGIDWNTVLNKEDGRGGIEELQFEPVQVRYVKMSGVKRALSYGYSLWEMEVYGELIQ